MFLRYTVSGVKEERKTPEKTIKTELDGLKEEPTVSEKVSEELSEKESGT